LPDARSSVGRPPRAAASLALVPVVLLVASILLLGFIAIPGVHGSVGATTAPAASPSGSPLPRPGAATSIQRIAPTSPEAVVGASVGFAWEALSANGTRALGFAVSAELTVTEISNGSVVRAWTNSSIAGPLSRSANGTFAVPATAWTAGVLNLSVTVGAVAPVAVRLSGPLLPSPPPPVDLTVVPDLDHLELYGPVVANASGGANDTFWHVRDRFGDPVPGALLIVEYSNGSWENTTLVPVTWAAGGLTGAWVNYSSPGPNGGTLVVRDEANQTLLGPVPVSPRTTASSPTTASLSPLVLALVALLVVAAAVAMAALLAGGRARPSRQPTSEEEELRRLAEGRETVVGIVRRSGPLGISEIEAAWDPPPAPAAVADWVASLVTDGTLTAILGEGGRARFALAPPTAGRPYVTLDEDALEEGIARRDAAVEPADEEGR